MDLEAVQATKFSWSMESPAITPAPITNTQTDPTIDCGVYPPSEIGRIRICWYRRPLR